ncbi:MAG: amidohydrolase family protein [Deltaproteobacteria bacterium]|jgi:cytosine/adenosine deaminase-related metal-dependent hydrolase|nr:amidohydrolase family protein [Deltaproteobacteria bacterium]
MASTLYTARYLLPITAPPIEGGALLVDGGRILASGSRTELRNISQNAKEIDFGDAVLMPPMVNAHAHLELSSFPDWLNTTGEVDAPRDFVDWILRLIRVRRNLDLSQFRDSLAWGLKESLRSGTGAVGDILTTLPGADVYQDSPLYGKVYAEVLGHDKGVVSDRLETIETMLGRPPGKALNWGLSPHAPYTLSSSIIDQVFAFSAEQSLQSSIHLAESAEESAFVRSGQGAIADKLYTAAQWDPATDPASGCSPVKFLCRAGRLRRNDLMVHGVQVDDSDISLVKRTGCYVALCPRSNAALDVGRAPVIDYLKAGVQLSLGTDSLASAPSLSIWHELAFARSWFAGDVSPRKWLEIATLGGARALGLQGRIGQLASGSDASFQVVGLTGLPAIDEVEEALCAAGESVAVSHLYLAAQNVLPES